MGLNDRQTYELTGLSRDDIERLAGRVEAGDYSEYDGTEVIEGFPIEREGMDMVSVPIRHSRAVAMCEKSRQLGISRAEFIRRAIDNELLALA